MLNNLLAFMKVFWLLLRGHTLWHLVKDKKACPAYSKTGKWKKTLYTF